MIDVTKLPVFKDVPVSFYYPEDGEAYFSFNVHDEMIVVTLRENECVVNGNITFKKFEDIPIKALLELPKIDTIEDVCSRFKLKDVCSSVAHSLYVWSGTDIILHIRHKYFDSIKVYSSDNRCFYTPNMLSLNISLMLLEAGGHLEY